MKKVLLGFVCLSTFVVKAQTREIVVIDRGTKEVVKSEPLTKRDRSSSYYRNVQHKNVFKFDPIRMSIGEINFGYERVIGEKSSLDFEIGPTISNVGFNRNFIDPVSPGTAFQRESAMGFFTSAAFRYYPLDDRYVLNQFYVSPKFKYRMYNEEIVADPLSSSLGTNSGTSNEYIFSFNFGMQQWLAESFSLDYYLGFGISGSNSRTYYPTSMYDGNTGNWIESWRMEKDKDARFILTAGLKVGIGK